MVDGGGGCRRARRRGGSMDGETAADDDARKWLRVKVDTDPEKFRARVGM